MDAWGNATEPRRDALYVVVPVTAIYVIIFVTGVVGNVVTCIVIAHNKHMHTATNYYLFSLAVSDLLLLLTGLPQEVVSIWVQAPYLFGEAFCVLRGLAAETSTNASVLTITAFTAERYIAICFPFLSHTMSKLSRAVRLIVLIWVAALAFAAPHAAQVGVSGIGDEAMCHVTRVLIDHSFELSTLLFFVVPMTVITVLYALIGLKLRRSRVKRASGHLQPHQADKASRRVVNMLAAVVVAFFVCWAPFHAQRLVAIYGAHDDHRPALAHIYSVLTYVSGILYYLSATINPILYHIMSLKFRAAFKETLVRCCHLEPLQGPGRSRSYSVLSRSQPHGRANPQSNSHSTDPSAPSTREDAVSDGDGDAASQPSRVSSRHTTWSLSETSDGGGDRSLRKSSSWEPHFSVVLRLRSSPPKRRRLLWRVLGRGKPRLAQARCRYYLEMMPPKAVAVAPASSISNSSLKDCDRGALREELALYMAGLVRDRDIDRDLSPNHHRPDLVDSATAR